MRHKIADIKNWQPVMIFGKKCIFTDERVNPAIPEGFYMYETRHWDDDWSKMCHIAPWVTVNFFGTVISNEPIPIVDWDFETLYVRNGEDYRYEDEDGVHMTTGISDIYFGDEVEDRDEAWSFEDYQNQSKNDDSKWNIPDECIENDLDVFLVKGWYDGVLNHISNAVDFKSKAWKRRIIVDIKDMNAKQINQIREILYQVRDLYKESSSIFEQERIIFKARPFTEEEFNIRIEALKNDSSDK